MTKLAAMLANALSVLYGRYWAQIARAALASRFRVTKRSVEAVKAADLRARVVPVMTRAVASFPESPPTKGHT